MGKAALRRHRTDRPVRRVGRRGAQRPLDHGRNLIVVDGSRPARTSLVEQAIAAILQEAAPPFANCVFVQAELGRDGLAGQSIRTAQTDAAPLGERSADAMSPSAPRGGYLERIPVEMRGKVRVVPVNEIEFIIASGPYAELYSGDRKYVIRESMQNLEERLDPNVFIRTHRSVIVRLDLIETLHKGAGGDYEVQLKSGRRLRVSRSRIEALEKKLGLSG